MNKKVSYPPITKSITLQIVIACLVSIVLGALLHDHAWLAAAIYTIWLIIDVAAISRTLLLAEKFINKITKIINDASHPID